MMIKLKTFFLSLLDFRDKYKTIISIIICGLLFLVGFNPLSLAKYFSVPLFLLVAFQFAKQKMHKPSLSFILVFSFSACYAIFYSISYGFDFAVIKHIFVPLVFYTLGSSKEPKSVLNYISFYFYGLMLGAFLNLTRTIADTGFDFNTDQRIYLYFFTGKSVAATLFSPFSDFAFAFFLAIFFYSDKTTKKTWILYSTSILGLLMSVYGFLLLKNRSFAVCSFLIVLVFLFFVVENKLVPLILIGITLLSLFFISLNIFGVAELLYKIPFFSRFISGGSNSNRINIYISFISNFWRFPFGGMSGSESFQHDYVHNVFLDVYSMAGVIPFLLFGAITYFTIFYIVKMARYRMMFCDLLFILLYFAIIALFLFEPILQADYYYFSLVFFLFGYFSNLRKNRKCVFITNIRWKVINV